MILCIGITLVSSLIGGVHGDGVRLFPFFCDGDVIDDQTGMLMGALSDIAL